MALTAPAGGDPAPAVSRSDGLRTQAPLLVGGLVFLVLFWEPFTTLLRDWWYDPEAAHGLLLGPLALYLMYRSGVRPDAKGRPALGLAILAASVLLRVLAALAAEMFTLRLSLMGAGIGLVVYAWGVRQTFR